MNKEITDQFYNLTPHEVLDAVEEAGFRPTGEYFQLNSYENRVFDIFLEKGQNPAELNNHIIVKFYRPQRWSYDCIQEEHDFLFDLAEQGIPAIAPLILNNNKSILDHHGLYMAAFPKGMGRLPQELTREQRIKIGQMLARLHNVGAQKSAEYRPYFTAETYGWNNLDILSQWVAPEVWNRYEQAAEQIIDYLEEFLNPDEFIRIHGDCHLGNLLLLDKVDEPQQFFMVDFDDFVMGPVEQDFWMLLSGSIENAKEELYDLIEGYEEFRNYSLPDLKVFEALRGLRILHYGAWIARRYTDPTFPKIFPQFEDYIYWVEETEALEKIAWSLNPPAQNEPYD